MCLRTFSATSTGMELECVFFSVTPYPASRSIMAFALTSNSRANSFIRTWFASDMLLKTLPLPVAPHSSYLLRTQPLLHFRFLRFRSSPPILPQLRQRHFARFQQSARSREQLPAIPLRLLQMPRRSLPPP